MAHTVKNLPAMRETQVRSLGQENPLEKELLPTPVFLSGESHRQRSLAGYDSWGGKESDNWATKQKPYNNPPVLQVDSLPAELPGKPIMTPNANNSNVPKLMNGYT